MHSAQGNAFNVSAVLQICAVFAAFQLRGFHLPHFSVSEGSMGSMT